MLGNLLTGINLSQEDKVLGYLLDYGFINNSICKEKLGNFQLSFIIRSLINKKVKIYKVQKVDKTSKGSKYYVNYFLAPYDKQIPSIRRFIDRYKEYKYAKEA